MNYTGKICDGCREPLENGDDIVVCPICGTPQHRSCYEKNNKCVNEYLHSSGFTWTDPDEERRKAEAEQAAQQEPEQTEQQAPFAQATPQSMEAVFMRGVLYDPKDDIGGATVGEAADYLQNSASRYIPKFMQMKKKNRKLSWNWAAFFFTPFWFFYRKLYKAGAVFLALSIALSLAMVSQSEIAYDAYEKMSSVKNEIITLAVGKEELSEEEKAKLGNLYDEARKIAIDASPTFALILIIQNIIPGIAAALVANFLLRKKMLKVISLAHDASKEPDVVKYSIMRSGGVAIIMPIIAILADSYLPILLLNIAYKINF